MSGWGEFLRYLWGQTPTSVKVWLGVLTVALVLDVLNHDWLYLILTLVLMAAIVDREVSRQRIALLEAELANMQHAIRGYLIALRWPR